FEDPSTHLAIVYDEWFGDRIAISAGIAIRAPSPHAGDEYYDAARVPSADGNSPAAQTGGEAQGLVKAAIMDRAQSSPWTPTLPPILSVAGTMLVQMPGPGRIRVEPVMGQPRTEVAGFGPTARTYIR